MNRLNRLLLGISAAVLLIGAPLSGHAEIATTIHTASRWAQQGTIPDGKPSDPVVEVKIVPHPPKPPAKPKPKLN